LQHCSKKEVDKIGEPAEVKYRHLECDSNYPAFCIQLNAKRNSDIEEHYIEDYNG